MGPLPRRSCINLISAYVLVAVSKSFSRGVAAVINPITTLFPSGMRGNWLGTMEPGVDSKSQGDNGGTKLLPMPDC